MTIKLPTNKHFKYGQVWYNSDTDKVYLILGTGRSDYLIATDGYNGGFFIGDFFMSDSWHLLGDLQ